MLTSIRKASKQGESVARNKYLYITGMMSELIDKKVPQGRCFRLGLITPKNSKVASTTMYIYGKPLDGFLSLTGSDQLW